MADKNINKNEEKVILELYYYVSNYKTPRYYQMVAVNRTVDAVAKGQESLFGSGRTEQKVPGRYAEIDFAICDSR